MRIRNRLATVLTVLACAGCLSTAPSEVGLGEEFVLGANQSVRIIGTTLTIAMRRVVGDDRCAIEVACVVEGSAGVQLDVFGSTASNPVELETSGADEWTDGTYRLRLLEVLPSPTGQAAIQPEEYRARLIVDLIPQ